jgi:predicted methyltransferase
MRKFFVAGALALGVVGVAHADDVALKAAIASGQRTPAYVQRDGARHPYQTLTFFGIKPTMTVVELSPGGGWYTEILAPYLRDKGKYIAGSASPDSSNEELRGFALNFQKKMAADPARFGKVKVGVFEPPAHLNYAPPGSVDMVLTFRNIHNWIALGHGEARKVFKSAYGSLKKGGVFGVVEHRLPAGMTQDATASTGYVHESYVIRLAEDVGFKLAAKSEINANPKDTADHPNGVWALPPTYRNKDVDRAKYKAIGESDRMTLRFVKP